MNDNLENQDNESTSNEQIEDIVLHSTAENMQKEQQVVAVNNSHKNTEECNPTMPEKNNILNSVVEGVLETPVDICGEDTQEKNDSGFVVPNATTDLLDRFNDGEQDDIPPTDLNNDSSVKEQTSVNLRVAEGCDTNDNQIENVTSTTETSEESTISAALDVVNNEHEIIYNEKNSEIKNRKRPSEDDLFMETNENKTKLSTEDELENIIEETEVREESDEENISPALEQMIDACIERRLVVFVTLSNAASRKARILSSLIGRINESQKVLDGLKQSISELATVIKEHSEKSNGVASRPVKVCRSVGIYVNEEILKLNQGRKIIKPSNKPKTKPVPTTKTQPPVKTNAKPCVINKAISILKVPSNDNNKINDSNIKTAIKVIPSNSNPGVNKTGIHVKLVKSSSRPLSIVKPVAKSQPVTVGKILSSNQTTITPSQSVILKKGNIRILQGNSKLDHKQTNLAIKSNAIKRPNGASVSQPITKRVFKGPPIRPQALMKKSHPAPVPPAEPHPPPNSQWLAPPPKPVLKIMPARSGAGITLSWNLPLTDQHASIKSYRIYAYPETSEPPSTDIWKTVGDVKALSLPMACTLTQFKAGNKYHFAVRAIDEHKRMGPNSDPKPVALTGSVLKS